ncbi:MAG TPA: ArsR family transcriptional regulator [Phycisphaerales bacterium]|nr:ArsR family transcriptional regulator [Phycisphaerales bacterium]
MTPQPHLVAEETLEFAASMFKLLGHPLRLRLVEVLDACGEMNVNDLADLTEQSQSTVSFYLNRLRTSGILEKRRDGNQTYYSVSEPRIATLLSCLRGCPLQ